MDNGLQQLFESHVLNEETKEAIKEAWDNKVTEMRQEVTNEIREEFSQKYDRDKGDIVEAMDQKINESLQEQINELEKEKKNAIQERVNYKRNARQHSSKFLKEASKVLEGEIKELQEDRKESFKKLDKFNEFIEHGIRDAVTECYEEHSRLSEDRVKLRANAKKELEESKKKTIQELAKAADGFIFETLHDELSQLKEDISEARQNNFGKKIYEAFMSEFSSSFHNENREFKKMYNALEERENKLEEARRKIEEKDREIMESKNKIAIKESQLKRQNILNELLAPLGKESKEVMEDMLKDVKTHRLTEHFNMYLPTLLEDSGSPKQKRVISESRKNLKEVTGDKKDLIGESKKNEVNPAVSEYIEAFQRLNQHN